MSKEFRRRAQSARPERRESAESLREAKGKGTAWCGQRGPCLDYVELISFLKINKLINK